MIIDKFAQSRPVSMNAGPYDVHLIQKGVWLIEDGTISKSCIYVVEGQDSAVVIDTGSECGGDLFAVVNQLTSLPWKLLITHAHPDHAAFLECGDIDAFYMAKADLPMLQAFYDDYDAVLSKWRPVDETTSFDLGGGVVLEVIACSGHTAGSLMYIDKFHGNVYCGDAFGSGQGVWMQTPSGRPMSEYKCSIEHALNCLEQQFGNERFAMLGGHIYQQYSSPDRSDCNPVCPELLRDMITLCEKCLDGTIELLPPRTGERAFGEEPVVRVTYHRAAAVCLRSRFC